MMRLRPPVRSLRWRTIILAIGGSALVIGVAAVTLSIVSDPSLRSVRADGVITIGYAIEAPYAFLVDGEPTGESIELARVVASRLGIPRVAWVQAEFPTLVAGLAERRYDVVAAGLFITPERSRTVAFSSPTFRVGQSLLVARGNPKGLTAYRQAAGRMDVRIAVLAGSVEHELFSRLGAAPPRLVVVPDAITGQAAVETGVADGFALSAPSVRWMAAHASDASIEEASPFTQDPGEEGWGIGGFAFRPGDRRLLRAWNRALRGFLGTAEHERLVAPFGFRLSELPAAGTVAP